MAHTWVTRYVETKCVVVRNFVTSPIGPVFMPIDKLGHKHRNQKGEVKEVTTASRLDKHQHTGMYTAQLYAAVCDYGTVVPVTCLRSDPSDLARSDKS